ncbi:MAG: hypothetical protein ACTSUY_05965 [Alphaproteobacteria bacterium]
MALTIYDGRHFLADIKPRGGTFVAKLAGGVTLGPFSDKKAATDAVFEYRRHAQGGRP